MLNYIRFLFSFPSARFPLFVSIAVDILACFFSVFAFITQPLLTAIVVTLACLVVMSAGDYLVCLCVQHDIEKLNEEIEQYEEEDFADEENYD